MTTSADPVQKAALHRLQSLAESDDNLDELLKGQAASKVVRMLKQPNADSGACLQPSNMASFKCSAWGADAVTA